MDKLTLPLPPDFRAAIENLAAKISGVAPIQAYQAARARLDNDAQARELLARLSAIQADLRLRQMHGGVAQADLDNLRAIQSEVQANSIIKAYAEAQQAAIAYLPWVNEEISQLLGMDFASMAGPASC